MPFASYLLASHLRSRPALAIGHLLLTGAIASLLAACSMSADDHAEGGLTVGENQRLERAAERIDQRTPSPAQRGSAQFEADVRQRLAEESNER